MIVLKLNNEAMDWNLTYTKKNGKDNYMKMMLVKRCLVFPNQSYSVVKVNVNDL